MNIIFVCRKFGNVAGGMERMCVAIMNSMVKKGHNIALITWDFDGAEAHYQVSPNINWLKLNCGDPDDKATWKIRWKRLVRAREFIRSFNTDVIIGFQSGGFIFGYVTSLFLRIPCVAAERVSPDTWRHVRTSLIDRFIDTYALILATKITVQFPNYINYYPFFLKKKLITIPNPIFDQPKVQRGEHEKILLNVGRLCTQKNQKFLIKSFGKIHKKHSDWKLVIVGDGDDEMELKELTEKMQLSKNVIFTGAIKNVSEWYSRADVFLFPSIFEGFPNALSEALAHGLPAVGFQETFGVNELIINNINGLLTENDEKSFSNAINYLIENNTIRKSMSEESIMSVSKYHPKYIFEQWNDFFLSLVSRNNQS